MFRREAHQRLAPVLAAFDVEALASYRVALGGATRIALAFGEVRVSRDVDLLCSDASGWARLRTAVSERGYAALFTHPERLVLPRLPTTDQYGVRFVVGPPEAAVKVELIREARIPLAPGVHEPFCALPCLALDDVFTEKLLANADRGDDPSQLDRDLIDLALLRSRIGPIPVASFDAAERAYGPSARAALVRVLGKVRRDSERLERDLRGLAVDDADLIRRGLDALAIDVGVESTDRDA